ncbi:Potassium efflux system KefA protein / Small-conductance mechanosensitive channel [Olavius algarvensis Delta 1 endosymbiont]|nr:Potassium efflux system KefA protein / Small-conductance mechanosensitive channel [Olavius algarvensis Delta 1 endosymbiont]
MKLRIFIHFILATLLTPMLVVTHAGAQEASSVEISSTSPKNEYSRTSANALLKPPNTASPRATLQSFIENMNLAYSMLMKAHRTNLKTPGYFPSEPVRQMATQAQEFFESGVECLNLSLVPKNLKKNTGYEGAIMLKEVFDRIDLPPFEEIPDAEAIEAEEEKEKIAELSRWRLPNTDIIIDQVEEGPREGEFLFTPETVARIEEFYGKVKDFPYKFDALISHDFYDFYVTNPGRLLPPKWSQWLPGWSDATYLDQTLWQWCALVFLPLGVLLLVWVLVRWWHRRTAKLSSGKKTAGWFLVVLVTVIMVSLIKYVLDVHINITGSVFIFVENTLQRVFILLLIGLILWQFLKSHIQKDSEEDAPEQESQGEEGGAGGSRIDTLLLLLRKTIVVLMFTIVFLLFLSSMGINIGPLLAGAGVVGLAIGFGAQTLVKDIIAGIFFLIDDAFRVGDFIETSGQKGMVEHISLRSLRLHNPRGPVHTIPFGSMGTVTNMSRDYIITKLDFRVRYDTDVDKVRKLIKKINKKIKKDPEMGPNLLDKIKSQGVKEMDDSAMIMRLKFKTIPGEQFVIRREVYRMIQESFRENGIEFAHRNVTVYMPPDENADGLDKNAVQAGAAAALAADQKGEEKAKSK